MHFLTSKSVVKTTRKVKLVVTTFKLAIYAEQVQCSLKLIETVVSNSAKLGPQYKLYRSDNYCSS